jgi:hypothetical protein
VIQHQRMRKSKRDRAAYDERTFREDLAAILQQQSNRYFDTHQLIQLTREELYAQGAVIRECQKDDQRARSLYIKESERNTNPTSWVKVFGPRVPPIKALLGREGEGRP